MTAQGGDGLTGGGSDPKYWYVLAAFVVTTLVSVVYVSFAGVLADQPTGGGAFLSLWLLGLVILAVLVYPALFLDATYIRRISSSWRPKSWHYILVGFATTLIVFTVASVVYQTPFAPVLAFVTFITLTFIVSTRHLYRRYNHLGKSNGSR